MFALEDVITLHMVGMMSIVNDAIQFQTYKKKAEIRLDKKSGIPELPDFNELKGNVPFLISSEVFAIEEKLIYLKSAEPHILRRVIIEIIKRSLPYLFSVMEEEKTGILYQSNYWPKENKIDIRTGLIDDVQILFLSIEKINPKRRGNIEKNEKAKVSI
jgi:hypothetical protein